MIIVRCTKLDQKDLWFYYHAHRWIHFIHFAYKTYGKILFYKIFFLKKNVVLYENV